MTRGLQANFGTLLTGKDLPAISKAAIAIHAANSPRTRQAGFLREQ
jgi:hypothetical protein